MKYRNHAYNKGVNRKDLGYYYKATPTFSYYMYAVRIEWYNI